MTRTIILSAIAVFTILLVWTVATINRAPASTLPSPLDTKKQTVGNVTVAVTPHVLIPGKPAVFQLIFDTHTVNLDFDTASIARLRDENGTVYGAAIWNGDPPGGHHRKGTLSFPIPIKKTSTVMLILNGIAGIKERVFSWNV